jgi:hypothetical protein
MLLCAVRSFYKDIIEEPMHFIIRNLHTLKLWLHKKKKKKKKTSDIYRFNIRRKGHGLACPYYKLISMI